MKHAMLLAFAAASALSLAACQKKAEPEAAATAPAPEATAAAPASTEVASAADTAGPIDPPAPEAAPAPASAGGPTESTRTMINGVTLTNMYQVEAGKIAEEKGQSQAVKDFGKAMVTDHAAMTNQMKHLFAATKVKVPTELGPRGQRMIEALKAAAPADFDKVYLNQQETAQAAELALLRLYAEAGDSTDLKPAAEKRIPAVQGHLEKVHELQPAQK